VVPLLEGTIEAILSEGEELGRTSLTKRCLVWGGREQNFQERGT